MGIFHPSIAAMIAYVIVVVGAPVAVLVLYSDDSDGFHGVLK
jgi:hypothetical protein